VAQAFQPVLAQAKACGYIFDGGPCPLHEIIADFGK